MGNYQQEEECSSVNGVCGDICECNTEVLHGLCPSQPNAIKCCPKNSTSILPVSTGDDCSQLTCTSGKFHFA